jgi:hypothetical protein
MSKTPIVTNHGEGDPEAAARFNDAEKRFVDSVRGKAKLRDGTHVRADERSSLDDAERQGKARSKGGDETPPATAPAKS